MLGIGEDRVLCVSFDPAYKDDQHIRIIDDVIKISYLQHPHVVSRQMHFRNTHKAVMWTVTDVFSRLCMR